MAIRIVDAGASRIANVLFGATAKDTTFSLQLFIAAAPPTLADTDAYNTFTIASTNGSAAKALTNNATISGTAPVQAAWAEQTFTLTGTLANPIQGYQIISSDNTVYAEELLASPVTAANGVTLKITPTITFGTGTPS